MASHAADVYLVTGANQGIGQGVVARLVREQGAAAQRVVVLVARKQADADAAKAAVVEAEKCSPE